MACKTRRDVTKRDIIDPSYTIEIGVSATAGEVGSTIAGTPTIGASAFMKVMLGTDSDWASGLGTSFEKSLENKYKLNKRSRRAWWINPGYRWPNVLAYTLPSNIMVAMLVGINENGANRRRTLITSGSNSPTTAHPISTHPGHTTRPVAGKSHGIKTREEGGSKSPKSTVITYKGVKPSEQLMEALGVDTTKSTTFQVEYDMPKDLLCMPEKEAKINLAVFLLQGIQQAADVEKVIVASISVPAGSRSDCARRLQSMSRSLKTNGAAVVQIEMVVVFKSATNMVVNQAAFLEMPGIKALVFTDTGNPDKLQIDNTYVPPAAKGSTSVAAEQLATGVPSDKEGVPVLPLALGCIAAAALLACASVVVVKRCARDGAAKQLRKERVDAKLCFGIPDEGEGPTGDFDECSIKDMKIILRKIGVPEEELVKCVEKSDFIKLMELVSQTSTKADDVENKLFSCAKSGDIEKSKADSLTSKAAIMSRFGFSRANS